MASRPTIYNRPTRSRRRRWWRRVMHMGKSSHIVEFRRSGFVTCWKPSFNLFKTETESELGWVLEWESFLFVGFGKKSSHAAGFRHRGSSLVESWVSIYLNRNWVCARLGFGVRILAFMSFGKKSSHAAGFRRSGFVTCWKLGFNSFRTETWSEPGWVSGWESFLFVSFGTKSSHAAGFRRSGFVTCWKLVSIGLGQKLGRARLVLGWESLRFISVCNESSHDTGRRRPRFVTWWRLGFNRFKTETWSEPGWVLGENPCLL